MVLIRQPPMLFSLGGLDALMGNGSDGLAGVLEHAMH